MSGEGCRAAVLFAESAMQALATRPVFRAALCGGEPLAQLLAGLRELPAFLRLDWQAVQLFALHDGWDAADLQRVHALPLPRANLHRPRSAGILRHDAARHYELTLRAHFGLRPGQLPLFDFVLLDAGGPPALAGGVSELALSVVVRSHGHPGVMLSSAVIETARRLVVAGTSAAPELRCSGEGHDPAASTARSSGAPTPATARAAHSGFARP